MVLDAVVELRECLFVLLLELFLVLYRLFVEQLLCFVQGKLTALGLHLLHLLLAPTRVLLFLGVKFSVQKVVARQHLILVLFFRVLVILYSGRPPLTIVAAVAAIATTVATTVATLANIDNISLSVVYHITTGGGLLVSILAEASATANLGPRSSLSHAGNRVARESRLLARGTGGEIVLAIGGILHRRLRTLIA